MKEMKDTIIREYFNRSVSMPGTYIDTKGLYTLTHLSSFQLSQYTFAFTVFLFFAVLPIKQGFLKAMPEVRHPLTLKHTLKLTKHIN